MKQFYMIKFYSDHESFCGKVKQFYRIKFYPGHESFCGKEKQFYMVKFYPGHESFCGKVTIIHDQVLPRPWEFLLKSYFGEE